MIDYSADAFAFPKQRPKPLDAEAREQTVATKDKAENAKARKRAGWRCEVRWEGPWSGETWRCPNKDTHTHHLIGGIGRRNVGKSILALYKLRVCHTCHKDIHGKVLQPTTAEHTALTVRFRRMR